MLKIFSVSIFERLIIEHSCFLSCILFYTEYCRIVNCCEEMMISNSRIKDIVESVTFCVHRCMKNKYRKFFLFCFFFLTKNKTALLQILLLYLHTSILSVHDLIHASYSTGVDAKKELLLPLHAKRMLNVFQS